MIGTSPRLLSLVLGCVILARTHLLDLFGSLYSITSPAILLTIAVLLPYGWRDRRLLILVPSIVTAAIHNFILNPAIGFPFFDAATGSLGQGLSVAAGLALAARADGADKKIFCIIGDGESREGQIWEAIDFIVDHKLTTVRMIFNCNGQGQADDVSSQQSAEGLAAKLAAFNCNVVTF